MRSIGMLFHGGGRETVYKVCSFAALAVLLALLVNHVSGLATASSADAPRLLLWIRWEGILLAVVGLVALVTRPRGGVQAALYTPVRIDTDERRTRYAKRGLILLVGLYRPQPNSPAAELGPGDWLSLAQEGDYGSLHLEKSNLHLAIEAVQAHAIRLEHCWILATASSGTPPAPKALEDTDRGSGADVRSFLLVTEDSHQVRAPWRPGSYDYVPVLVEYLRKNNLVSANCKFHHGTDYNLNFDVDDVSVSEETRRVVDRIFEEAKRLGLGARDMAADISSCPRNMVLGMVLACLDKERDVQFIGTNYDANGMPVGGLVPILYTFSPRMATK